MTREELNVAIKNVRDWVEHRSPIVSFDEVKALLDTIDALTRERDKLVLESKAGRELREGVKSLTGKHVTAANVRLGLNMLCDAYDDDTATKETDSE